RAVVALRRGRAGIEAEAEAARDHAEAGREIDGAAAGGQVRLLRRGQRHVLLAVLPVLAVVAAAAAGLGHLLGRLLLGRLLLGDLVDRLLLERLLLGDLLARGGQIAQDGAQLAGDLPLVGAGEARRARGDDDVVADELAAGAL